MICFLMILSIVFNKILVKEIGRYPDLSDFTNPFFNRGFTKEVRKRDGTSPVSMECSNNVCSAGNKAYLHFFIIMPGIPS